MKGEAPVGQCPVGGSPVAEKVGKIMGVEASESARQVAFVKCAGNCEKASKDYVYTGVEDCAAMAYDSEVVRSHVIMAVWDLEAV